MTKVRMTLALSAAGAALAASLVGCSAVDKALDCAQLAADVADNVNDLQNAVSGAGESPQAVVDALNAIDTDLRDWEDKTDNTDLTKAVDDLQQAVENARDSTEAGTVPDVTPVADAAGEISKVCTS